MSYWVFSLDSVYEAFHHIVQQKGYHVLSLEINTRWSSCTPSPTFLSTTIGYAVEIEFLLATATYSFWKSCISRILCSLRFVTSLSLVFAVCCKRSNNSLHESASSSNFFFPVLYGCIKLFNLFLFYCVSSAILVFFTHNLLHLRSGIWKLLILGKALHCEQTCKIHFRELNWQSADETKASLFGKQQSSPFTMNKLLYAFWI